MSREPTARILEHEDQSRQVVKSYAPLSTLSIVKGLKSLEWGPGALYTKALLSLVKAKCLESGENLTQEISRFVRNRCRTERLKEHCELEEKSSHPKVYLMREIRCISPSSLTASRETPFGEMSAVV